jgi:RHS repeat-associated protein
MRYLQYLIIFILSLSFTGVYALDKQNNNTKNKLTYAKSKLKERSLITYRFAGQYFDVETELCYNRFRYYSSEEGQYISQDPIGLAGINPTMYGYVRNNNYQVDTFGLSSTVLNNALGGVTGDGMQAHHLIPEEIWGRNQTFLDQIGIGRERDFASNGVLLHDNEADARSNQKPVWHRGSHANYSDMVNTRVQDIQRRHAIHGNDARARQEIADLQNRLRRALTRNSRGGCRRLS